MTWLTLIRHPRAPPRTGGRTVSPRQIDRHIGSGRDTHSRAAYRFGRNGQVGLHTGIRHHIQVPAAAPLTPSGGGDWAVSRSIATTPSRLGSAAKAGTPFGSRELVTLPNRTILVPSTSRHTMTDLHLRSRLSHSLQDVHTCNGGPNSLSIRSPREIEGATTGPALSAVLEDTLECIRTYLEALDQDLDASVALSEGHDQVVAEHGPAVATDAAMAVVLAALAIADSRGISLVDTADAGVADITRRGTADSVREEAHAESFAFLLGVHYLDTTDFAACHRDSLQQLAFCFPDDAPRVAPIVAAQMVRYVQITPQPRGQIPSMRPYPSSPQR